MTQTLTKPASLNTDVFWEKFERFQKTVGADQLPWLLARRKAGLSRFVESGFPTTQDEDWRFTNVAPIAKLPFLPVLEARPHSSTMAERARACFEGLSGNRLVFVDGHFSPELSKWTGGGSGLRIAPLSRALQEDSSFFEQHLDRLSEASRNPFVALNTAFFTDGLYLQVPAGQAVAEPVHLVHLSTSAQSGAAAHVRNLIVAERGSAVTVMESYLSAAEVAVVTNVVTELVAGENATIEHCKFQEESPSAFHLGALHAEMQAHANVRVHSFALGARLSRNDIRTALGGEGVEAILNGLYLTKDDQLADHYMIVDHAQPHCNSHEYFNGILDGHSKGVFHGRILVRPGAQKTDAKQTNKNLLLSDDASVDTKPQLEIYADDVKCTHGATIGQLNQESVFYLRARGIGEETARRMLMHAFAGEIIDRIQYQPMRERLDRLVWDRLEQNALIAVKS